MSKSPEEYKLELESLSKPYLDDLRTLLAKQLVFADLTLHTEERSKKEGSPKKDKGSEEEIKLFIRRLYDFQSVIMMVYNGQGEENKSPMNLLDYINYFNERGVITMSMQNPKVHTLIENLQTLNENDLDVEWLNSFSSEKIDIPALINQLLEHLSSRWLQKIAEQYEFLQNPQLREYRSDKYLITAKKDHSKVILSDVKFRSEITDVKSIVLRAIESLNTYKPSYEYASKFLLVFLYTNEQDHVLSKIVAQFRKHLVEIEESLIGRIFCIPISIYKPDDLSTRIQSCFKSINGFEITFDYSDSPLSHGWRGPEDLTKSVAVFRHIVDQEQGNTLQLQLPISWSHYIDYPLKTTPQPGFQSVSFILKPGRGYNFYIEFSIKDSNKKYWFKIENGKDEPKFETNTEYTIYSQFIPFGNWSLVKINVPKEFENTFGKDGNLFNRIEGVRLRGEMDIAKINFE